MPTTGGLHNFLSKCVREKIRAFRTAGDTRVPGHLPPKANFLWWHRSRMPEAGTQMSRKTAELSKSSTGGKLFCCCCHLVFMKFTGVTWLTTSYKFQVCRSVTRHLYTQPCAHRLLNLKMPGIRAENGSTQRPGRETSPTRAWSSGARAGRCPRPRTGSRLETTAGAAGETCVCRTHAGGTALRVCGRQTTALPAPEVSAP